MQRKTVTIREDQEEWIQNNHLKLSAFIRDQIDKVMEEEKEEEGLLSKHSELDTISPTPRTQEPPLIDEDRRVAFRGGYNSAIPTWSGTTSFVPGLTTERSVTYIPIRTRSCDLDTLTDYLEQAEFQLGLKGRQEQFAFTLQCNDFGWYGSGIDEFRADIATPWETAESLKQQLARPDESLEITPPAFGAIAHCRTGRFWLSLRTKTERGEPLAYEIKSGIIVNDPLFSWETLSSFIGSQGPVFQKECQEEAIQLSFKQYRLRDTQPTRISGDLANTIGAANPLYDEDILPEEDNVFETAVTKPSRLPWRIRGGTVGFSNEHAFRIRSLDVTHLDIPHVSGIAPVFVDNHCMAQSEKEAPPHDS